MSVKTASAQMLWIAVSDFSESVILPYMAAFKTPKELGYPFPVEWERQEAICFPDREIVAVDCSDIIKEGSALHCMSQHQPAVS
tara:strand:+ start:134 stop:385 length:252 start_codon:yes stop_codon:yes gene_type:complete